jgi:hypothetical protein
MKSLLIRVPADESFDTLGPEWQEAIRLMRGEWAVVGRVYNGEKVLDVFVNDLYIVPGELDEQGNPLTPTAMPEGWKLAMAWRRVRDQDQYDYTDPENPVLVEKAWQPMMPMVPAPGEPSLIEWYPDLSDGSRPTEITEIHRWMGVPARI